MDKQTRRRLSRMVDGFKAVLDEAARRGLPVEPVPGMTHLVQALEALLSGDEKPVLKLLGFINPQPGTPGYDDAMQFEKLREFRKLRNEGMSDIRAAAEVGVDVRTITRWRAEAVGYAEAVDAKMSGVTGRPRAAPRKGRTRTKLRP